MISGRPESLQISRRFERSRLKRWRKGGRTGDTLGTTGVISTLKATSAESLSELSEQCKSRHRYQMKNGPLYGRHSSSRSRHCEAAKPTTQSMDRFAAHAMTAAGAAAKSNPAPATKKIRRPLRGAGDLLLLGLSSSLQRVDNRAIGNVFAGAAARQVAQRALHSSQIGDLRPNILQMLFGHRLDALAGNLLSVY